ncbi:phosphomannomutase/phosphoglucomutase [Candidatus Pelagibacter sp.]|jgi:phosphomannomutase/phosphoglucomutase|uniref:phosphomannomutase/phosphoglucomutase n=1 Tax=uncultured Candidatus Pelagibacter sp. TaxID=372654 RepID=UPI002371DB65|nr:phosphomannomutase/phosphoglucomutase [uncultured Candidatus Pelagibacter sp.]MDB4351373.1 phosphomannomutase/phosphoglucomutase [Candidatus Pelagibacter sp.]MDC0897678.1 phosphomannomutase/phosphoglucomutase [Candidatus Pelagibacter sp.]MDC0899635.1 phosphomannomutase/phosphoglucomutase [Candidatus Pelagibacter sp.]
MNQNIKIDPYGFREYDARWLYEKDISKEGITNLGKGLGTQIKKHTQKENPRVIVGHDYRSYSEEIKSALKKGLISTGCHIEDVGLSLSPMVYFAQFNLDADAVAMVTASHNENGWTGVKMGIKKGLTHAPEEMKELKEITLNENFSNGEGNEKKIENFQQVYKDDLISGNKINKKLKAVVACGNGTAGVFAPDILRGIGCEVIELDCNLDWTFPKYNPNPEDLEMLHAIAKAVKDNNADIGFGFDGDGDRVGVIDNQGNEIFSDKIGLLIARNLSTKHKNSKFVVDVKSTGLYSKDNVLLENNCETIYWKTGHSHIKRKVNNEKALAGFEKSGHFFFNQPLGYGYDDGINSAIHVCHLLDNQNKMMSEIINELPNTYQTPTMAPFCKDEEKYQVVEELVKQVEEIKKNKIKIDDQIITEVLTVNGVRFSFEDGSWGLIRASSNKPSLVIVTESPTSDIRKKKIFYFIDDLLQKTGKVGEYDQKI